MKKASNRHILNLLCFPAESPRCHSRGNGTHIPSADLAGVPFALMEGRPNTVENHGKAYVLGSSACEYALLTHGRIDGDRLP